MKPYPLSIVGSNGRCAWNRSNLLALGLILTLSGRLSLPAAEQKPHESQWEKAIQSFEASDKTNAPPPNAVLFIGSSSIRLWTTLQHDFPGHKVIKRGFGGSHLSDCVAFTDRIVVPYKPKLVLI